MTDIMNLCKRGTLLTVVSMALLLSGCATNRILSADFDNYDEDARDFDFVVASLPGLPDGDQIFGFQAGLSIAPNGPAGGGNNLRIIDDINPTQLAPASITFQVANHELPSEYRIVWEGSTEEPAQQTSVTFLDEGENEALRLFFVGSKGLPQQVSVLSGDPVEGIPVHPTSKHEVLVTINPGDNEAGVRYESSDGVETLQNLALSNANFKKLDKIVFASESPAGAYYLSHLNVVAKD